MTSLSSRLPAYFVVPAPLLEEDVEFFQGRGIPVSALKPWKHGLLIGPFWQIILLKDLLEHKVHELLHDL